MGAPEVDPLIPIARLLPDWTPRQIADACRAKRIPKALKIGRVWLMLASDYASWTGGEVPRETSAEEDLRAFLSAHRLAKESAA